MKPTLLRRCWWRDNGRNAEIRPATEARLGAPVEFVVKTLRIKGNYAYIVDCH